MLSAFGEIRGRNISYNPKFVEGPFEMHFGDIGVYK